MIFSGQRINQVKFKKLANGKIVKSVEEQYLRQDIPCGLTNCPICDVNENCNLSLDLKGMHKVEDVKMAEEFEDESENARLDKIFIVDHHFALNQIDLMENCNLLTNVIVPDSVLKYIQRKNIQAFHALKNIVEQDARQFYYFYNENFHDTFINDQQLKGKGSDTKLRNQVAGTYQWYFDHMKELTTTNKVYLLTDNSLTKKEYSDLIRPDQAEGVISIDEFIHQNKNTYPELINFLGFSEDIEQQDDQMQGDDSGADLFEDHLSFSEMILGIKQGLYFQGRLNVSRVTIQEATVSVQGLNQDLLILGTTNQNRALNGDIVCLEVLRESDWAKNYKAGAPMNVIDQDFEEYVDIGDQNEDPENKSKVVQPLMQRINNEVERRVTAKVRGVLKKMSKTYGGSILSTKDMTAETKAKYEKFCSNLNISQEERFKYRVFVPYNIQVPQAIVKSVNPSVLEKVRFIVRINNWSKKSPFPQCQFVKILGEEGKVKTESAMILHEFNVDTRAFSQKVLRCLPSDGANWSIPQEEIDKRLDIRHLAVCSVDPIGCKDIDDALHCRILPNGNYEVGVHIADVTHFVKPNSEIDREAARRCTTVYLVDKRTDMLPGLLTENLCSIRGGVERLVFSIIWEIDSKSFQIQKVQYTKSVIKSRAALDYYTAQKMIDDKSDNSELTESLRRLLKIATVLRDRRNEKGALTLSSPEIKFKFEGERENPTDVTEYQHVSTHYMIEEFMLLGNIAVAEKIVQHYPSFAILRRHPQPKQKEIQDFVEQLAKFGYEVSVDSSKSFAESLNRAVRPNDPQFNKLVRMLATRCMHQAVYFCLADFDVLEVFHYGLAVPLYTHFTSPIRRYADVLVHRLLAATLDIQSLTNDMTDKFKMARQCDQMNRKNRLAALASQASVAFNTFLYFNIRQYDKEEAIVMKLSKAGIYIMVQKYGIEGFLAESENTTIEYDQANEESIINGEVRVKTFDHLTVEIVAKTVEFRRSISLQFIKKIEVSRKQVQDSGEQDDSSQLQDALISKSKKKKGGKGTGNK